jgi:hypothetical protein
MRITNVECYPVWGGRKNFLFVVVDTDEGIYGVGESGLSSRELAVQGAIEHFKPQLIGQDPMRIEHIWQTLWRGGFFPAGGIVGGAVSAIDIALWDIKGKALGVPVYELLGGLTRDKVVCYPHVTGDSIESLIENALQHVEEGWKFVRWGLSMEHAQGNLFEPRAAIRHAAKQWEAMRDAVGEEIELCFDMHTRIEPPEAIWLCREVEQYRPFFMEDPIRSESMESVRVVRRHVNVPLAIGEQFAGKWAFRQIIEEELTDSPRRRRSPPPPRCTTSSWRPTTPSARSPAPPASTSISPAATSASRSSPPGRAPSSPTSYPSRWTGRTATSCRPPAPASASSSTAKPPRRARSRCTKCRTSSAATAASRTGKGGG